jgi:hypothetical protein
VVLFKFRDDASAASIARIETAFTRLPGQIPGILEFEWGTNISPENLDQGFTHCFVLTFGTEADRDAYLTHPAHRAFVGMLDPALEKALVVDYRAQR